MKVLIVNPIMYTNETDNLKKVRTLKDTLMYNVCLGFLANGVEPTLIASADFKPIIDETYPFNILFFKTRFRKICYPRIIPFLSGLNKYLKEHKSYYDLVICSESFSLATLTACKVFKQKSIIWQEMAKHQRKFFKIPSKIWHNIIVRFFLKKNLVVARSEQAKIFISRYSKNVSKFVVEHGMNIDNFPCRINETKKQFIVVSQLIERKRINLILETFSDFCNKYSDYKLFVCGDGVLRQELQSLCVKLNIEKNVFFLGHCNHEQLSLLYCESMALLIYTKQDNNMVSIIESICSGTPVITTSVPYNSSYVEKYKLGIVNDNWGVPDLERIVNQNYEYKRNCFLFRENLSAKKSASKLIEIYKNEL